jgi:hypothetical protein
MTTTDLRQVRLDRAYVQSKVITANLEHLTVMLSAADPRLHEDVATFTVRFAQYVRRLHQACNPAAHGEEGSFVRREDTSAAAAAGR